MWDATYLIPEPEDQAFERLSDEQLKRHIQRTVNRVTRCWQTGNLDGFHRWAGLYDRLQTEATSRMIDMPEINLPFGGTDVLF